MTVERVTTKCAALGHPEFLLAFDPNAVLEADVEWLTDFLQRSVLGGARYQSKETIQIGWVVDTFSLKETNVLVVQEPDFGAMPIEYRVGVTATLTHLRLQSDVAQALSVESQFPSILESAIVCNRLSQGIGVAERFGPAPRDSGWFFGCGDQDHDHGDPSQLTRTSLYSVGLEHRRLLPFVALPEGFRLVFSGAGVTFERSGEPVVPSSNSVVARIWDG